MKGLDLYLESLWGQLYFVLLHLSWWDLLDLALVWLVTYKLISLIRKTGTIQMLSGLGVMAALYLFSIWGNLVAFNWLLEKFFANLFVIIVILFQGEIRRALAQIGSNPFTIDTSSLRETQIIEEVVKGTFQCAQRRYGALIVLEKEILIDFFIEPGTEIDAQTSAELIVSIFDPSAPMHDGALLVRNGKIHSAGNFLPLSKNPLLDKNLGTRHRAAIGITEETDALVLIVSEENQSVSIVQSGQLTPVQDSAQLRRELYDFFQVKFRGAEHDIKF
jgi:diadenylate cyclase